jgi:hypothetical protein
VAHRRESMNQKEERSGVLQFGAHTFFRQVPCPFPHLFIADPCYVGPCHHGMARPQVAGGGDGLQIWRVAGNILNKQSRTADKGRYYSLGIVPGTKNSSPYSLLRSVIEAH